MSQPIIEALADEDITGIAGAWLHADGICHELLEEHLDRSEADLARLQRILDSGVVDRSAKYTLQSLGIAFGEVFVSENPEYGWWMVEDEYGRDPAVRYRQSSLLAHPRGMILKRVEDGEAVDVAELYENLRERLEQLVAQGYGTR